MTEAEIEPALSFAMLRTARQDRRCCAAGRGARRLLGSPLAFEIEEINPQVATVVAAAVTGELQREELGL